MTPRRRRIAVFDLDGTLVDALAGWNPRVVAEPGDLLLRHPAEVLELLSHA